MQKFILTLFSVIALLGLVDRSSAQGIGYANRDTNANRLARGLPPHPPTRRSTAKRQAPSHVLPNYNIQVTDGSNKSQGYLSCGDGVITISPNPSRVAFNSHTGTLSCRYMYIGANITDDLNSGNVILEEVSKNDNNSETRIWVLQNGQLNATWTFSNGSMTPVHFNSVNNSIVLSGVPLSGNEVFLYTAN